MRARKIYESLDFERGMDPKEALEIGHFRDKNGIMIRKGDSVFADPESGDTFYEFQGTVDSFHDNYVTVRDMEDDYFDIEPYKLEVLDESVSFERGVDPKRSIKIGHAGIYPEKTLFLDIYKYCKENKFPGFPMLTPIHWPENTAGSSLSEPFFKAYVNDGSKDPSLKNVYTVYLTRNEGVVSFHEYENYLGEWQEQEHPIKYLDYWRRMMEANHIRTIYTGETKVEESIDFQRGEDPHKSLRLGKYSKSIPEIISGDIERMPEPGNQDTYFEESVDSDEIEWVLNNWEDAIREDNYSFWLQYSEGEDPEHLLWKDLEGDTVMFADKVYDIPKTKYKMHP